MDESSFDNLGRDELAAIEDAFEHVDPDDVDVSSSDGVLTLELRDGVKVVINTHRAARQIWMAAVASAWKFDYDPHRDAWLSPGGDELRATIEQIIRSRLGVEVALRGETSMRQTNPFLQVIRVWAALAWADDVIAEEEAAAMTRLIDSAGLGDADRATALGYLETKVELDTAGMADLSENARLGIYKAAVRLAGVDHDFAPQERALLDRLRGGLSIAEDVAATIEADVSLPG